MNVRNPLFSSFRHVRFLRLECWRMLLLGSIWLAAGSGFAGATEQTEPSGAVLEFSQDQLDVGTVRVSELTPFKERLEFVNRGDQPLILSSVRGCCGTRITEWPQAPIMPGDTGHIDIEFRLATRPHAVRRTVTVTSNATSPTQVHRITGQVILDAPVQVQQTLGPRLVFSQPTLDLGAVMRDQGDAIAAQILFENRGDEDLVLSQVRAGGGAEIRAWPTDPIPPGQAAQIELHVLEQDAGDAFSLHVFIISNDRNRRHTYRVSGQWATP